MAQVITLRRKDSAMLMSGMSLWPERAKLERKAHTAISFNNHGSEDQESRQ